MKKIFISAIIFCFLTTSNLFSQSTTISPFGDEILLTKYSGTPGAGSVGNLAGRRSNGTASSPTASSAALDLVSFSGRGHTGSFFTGDRAQLLMTADEAFTSSANGTRMTFLTTTNGTTTLTERMRIDNTGNVGIGTTNPLGKLEIDHSTGGSDSNPQLRLRQTDDLQFGRVRMENSDGSRFFMHKFDLGSIIANANFYYLLYNSATLMTVRGDGNVGIGNTSPSTKLHVSKGSSGITPNASAVAIFEDNTNNYMQLASPEANENGVLFGKPSSSASGGIIYNSSNDMNIRTGGNFTRVTIGSDGKVGIGTTNPTAKLDIEGDIVVKKTTNATVGTINALSRSGGSSLFMNGAGTVTVNGIAGGVDGMILYLICGNSTTLVLAHENASAAAGDRITTQTAANVTISLRGGAVLIYESSTAKWRIIGFAN